MKTFVTMPYDHTLEGIKFSGDDQGGADIVVERLAVTENGTYTADEGTAYNVVKVNVPQLTTYELTTNGNGVYTPEEGKAYNKVTVNVPIGSNFGNINFINSSGFHVSVQGYKTKNDGSTINDNSKVIPETGGSVGVNLLLTNSPEHVNSIIAVGTLSDVDAASVNISGGSRTTAKIGTINNVAYFLINEAINTTLTFISQS